MSEELRDNGLIDTPAEDTEGHGFSLNVNESADEDEDTEGHGLQINVNESADDDEDT